MRVAPNTHKVIAEVEYNLSAIYGQIARELARLEELPGTGKYVKKVCLQLTRQIRERAINEPNN